MGNSESINNIDLDNILSIKDSLRIKYLYTFYSKNEVKQMSKTERYFYSSKYFFLDYVKKNNDKILNFNIYLFLFLSNSDKFKTKFMSIKNMNENKFINTMTEFELTTYQEKALQYILNSRSNYEEFMYDICLILEKKLHNNKTINAIGDIIMVEKDDKPIIPLIGLHSTTYDAYYKIIKNGFDSKKGEIYGEKDNWPVALFTSPFLNLCEINSSPQFLGRSRQQQLITLTNGITRMLRKNEKGFPIIIAVFKNIKKSPIKIDGYIESYDKKNIIIIGTIHVSFSDSTMKKIKEEFERNEKFEINNNPKLKFNYKFEWVKKIKNE